MDGQNTTAEEATTPIMTTDGGRVTIRLNRPRQHNRLEPADLAALEDALAEIDANAAVRVLVLTGTGRSFSSGYHIGALAERRADERPQRDDNAFERVTNRLERVRVPTICALNGGVYGGSTDLALACDFRIGVAGVKLLMPAGRLGVHYYSGGLQRYVTRLGLSAAKRLFLTAQPIDDQEMLRIGFLDEIAPPEEFLARVDALADQIAANAPLAVCGMKRALNDIARGELDVEAIDAARATCQASEDLAEGLAAWAERRQPAFRGR